MVPGKRVLPGLGTWAWRDPGLGFGLSVKGASSVDSVASHLRAESRAPMVFSEEMGIGRGDPATLGRGDSGRGHCRAKDLESRHWAPESLFCPITS